MLAGLFLAGYVVQTIAGVLLLVSILKKRSIYGLSNDTQMAYLLATLSRFYWSFRTQLILESYFAVELVTSMGVVVALNYLMWRYRHTTTRQAWWPLRVRVLAPTSLILAATFHPGAIDDLKQMGVAFTIYLEAGALIPQLYLFRKMIEVDAINSYYVALLALSRVFRIFFWIRNFMLQENHIHLFIADCLHTLLLGNESFNRLGGSYVKLILWLLPCVADYMYMWLHKMRDGSTLIYKI